jgi:hypothetical protein
VIRGHVVRIVRHRPTKGRETADLGIVRARVGAVTPQCPHQAQHLSVLPQVGHEVHRHGDQHGAEQVGQQSMAEADLADRRVHDLGVRYAKLIPTVNAT